MAGALRDAELSAFGRMRTFGEDGGAERW